MKYWDLPRELEKHEVYHRGEICMELHWQSDYQMQYTFDAFWERREERPFMGSSVAVMGVDDRYPALFAHAAERGFMRLRWLLGIVGPTTHEFELIDLPDWLFWLYFIIRPFNWVRRKLFGGTK